MNIDQVQKGLEEVIEQATQIYKDEAEAEIRYRDVEKGKETKFALLEFEYDDGKLAKNRIESKVYANVKWATFLTELHLVKAEWIRHKAKVKALETKLEALRSLNKTYQLT